jgi:phage-related protein (TIGR01555 family)
MVPKETRDVATRTEVISVEDVRAMQAAHAKSAQRIPTLATGVRNRTMRVLDGFKNLVTNLGVRGRDRTTANQINATYILTFPELTALYLGDGLAKRTVDMPAEDATRAGWDIEGDPDGKLVKAMDAIGVKREFTQALKWKRLHGGALTIMLWDDGLPLDVPFVFNPKRKLKLRGMRTHSPAEIWIMPEDICKDELSLRYDMPEYFTIRRMYGPPYVVHHSRTLEWRGMPTPDRTYPGLDVYRRYWGFGIVQSAVQAMSDLGISWSSVSSLFQESTIGKYKLSNFESLLMENDYDSIMQRMQNLEMSKSSLKGVMLGAEEEYTRDSLPFTGVADVLDRMMMRYSSEVGIPVSLLFGRSAAGLNATGEGDARQYYDSVSVEQNDELYPRLLQVAKFMAPYILPGVDEDELSPKFKPVWSMSEKEFTECRYKQAQADSLDVVNCILSPKEVRRNRFVGGYSFATHLLSTETEPPIPPGQLAAGAGDPEHGGNLSAHVGANASANVPGAETRESTKTRSAKEGETGSTKAGSTTIHAPSGGNRTKATP